MKITTILKICQVFFIKILCYRDILLATSLNRNNSLLLILLDFLGVYPVFFCETSVVSTRGGGF